MNPLNSRLCLLVLAANAACGAAPTPHESEPPEYPVRVAAGRSHAAIATNLGRVLRWGDSAPVSVVDERAGEISGLWSSRDHTCWEVGAGSAVYCRELGQPFEVAVEPGSTFVAHDGVFVQVGATTGIAVGSSPRVRMSRIFTTEHVRGWAHGWLLLSDSGALEFAVPAPRSDVPLGDPDRGLLGTFPDAVSIRGAVAHGCIFSGAGEVSCWDGGAPVLEAPLRRIPLPPLEEFDWYCGRTGDGVVYCWGPESCVPGNWGTEDGHCLAPAEGAHVPLPAAAVELAYGDRFACALLVDGAVYCWGRNGQGQCGDGTREYAREPVRVVGIPGPSP